MSVVGLGWGRPEWLGLTDGATLEDVLNAIAASPNPDWKSGPTAVRTLAEKMEVGDLVWTRDSSGAYWLGRLTEGGWQYDISDEASKWDLNNVRPCEWLTESFRDYEVPGAVVRAFTGPGSSLRRVDPEGQEGWLATKLLYEKATDPSFKWLPPDSDRVITDLLEATDVEDFTLLSLQDQGWILIPSSRMNDTPLYEAALIHSKDGRLAVVSVKSGARNQVPVQRIVDAVSDAQVFVCSTHDAYSVEPESVGATPITRADLVKFMSSRPELLPPRIARWLTK